MTTLKSQPGILYEFDLLYSRDIARRTEIAILRRAPGGPWEIHYYMGGYGGLTQEEGEPGEVFEERKERDLERRITKARARVQLHRWTARKEFLNEEFVDHERVTREACCEHTSDCAIHNEPAYPVGPCNCDMTQDGQRRDYEETQSAMSVVRDHITQDEPRRMTGPAREESPAKDVRAWVGTTVRYVCGCEAPREHARPTCAIHGFALPREEPRAIDGPYPDNAPWSKPTLVNK